MEGTLQPMMFGVAMPSKVHGLERDVTEGLASPNKP